MQELNLTLFIYLAIPMSMLLFLLKGNSRNVCAFLIIGMFSATLSGEVNSIIEFLYEFDTKLLSINVAPLVEEIAKAIPIIFVAFIMKPTKQSLCEYALATGVGFATFENICVLINAGSFSLLYVLLRAIGAGIMHGVCTLSVGITMRNVIDKKSSFIAGTLSAVSVAIISHSIYNMLVESKYMIVGVFIPIASFTLIMIANHVRGKEILNQIKNR